VRKPKFLQDTQVSMSSDPQLKGLPERADLVAARRRDQKDCERLGLSSETRQPNGEITRRAPRDQRLS
jgi:hypothetical protein